MSDEAAIRHRYFAEDRGFGAWRKPIYVSMDRLDVLMANANKHFSAKFEKEPAE